MGEKKGNTVKIQHDFNPSRCLEINYKGKWYRVTANEFRSWTGERRILNIDNPSTPFYEEYNGPVYKLGTNIISRESTPEQFEFENGEDPRKFGTRRKYESF